MQVPTTPPAPTILPLVILPYPLILLSSFNIAIGDNALILNTTGSANIAIGDNALYNNISGSNNIANGNSALNFNTTGSYNIANGNSTLVFNTTGSYNIANGTSALFSNTSGSNNIANGTSAMILNTTGSNNIAIGYQAGYDLSSGSSNIIIGNNINLPSNTGSQQLNIGNLIYGTGVSSTTGVSSSPSGGLVGIGTTTPFAALSVQGASNGTTPLFAIGTTTNGTAYNTPFQINSNGTLTMNTPGATSTITGNLYVNGTLRATNSYVGDLFFGNNWRITEAPLDGTPQGLLLKNQNDNTALSIDQNGNLTINGDVCSNGAQCFGKSLSSLTKDVNTLASTTAFSILSATVQGQSLSEISVSLSSTTQALAILSAQMETLSSTTAMLQSALATSTLASSTAETLATSTSFVAAVAQAVQDLIQSAGKWVVQEITATLAVFTDVKTNTIETQTAAVTNGLEMTDSATGQIYCVRITNGNFDKVPGSCGENATSTPPVATTTFANAPANPVVTIPTPVTPIISSTTNAAATTTVVVSSTDTTLPTDSTLPSTTTPTVTTTNGSDPATSTAPASALPAEPVPSADSGTQTTQTDSPAVTGSPAPASSSEVSAPATPPSATP